jgi:hypothetical protein
MSSDGLSWNRHSRENQTLPNRHLRCTDEGPVDGNGVSGRTEMATDFARTDYAHSEGRVAKTIEEQTAKLLSFVKTRRQPLDRRTIGAATGI